ncbi:alkaline phosphatase D family protein [Neoroseomonas oryzicola]|uniref:Alkaline phosphatase n=1 Tax=Neoroseomonas oryzicola TaxID=535904 RepID=A0A9X9WEL0_9PROT|nr:alkaline phosphatase D family protein [Neoroseomonas oryzicola]MBR0658770.1 alkaline phosphatase [Neoroseomonas oryzicola]NKE17248.1 alkaline phosphatase [Neoroseomonas oryzicola]
MDSIRRHILDLSRRGLLRGATGLAALGAIGAPSRDGLAQQAFRAFPFALGVASGEPAPDGFVIWTRLAPDPLAPDSGMPRRAVPVTWEVAEDEAFARIAASGSAVARPELAHAVHVEVAGLSPGRPYFYRFQAGGAASATGRARTAPAPGATPSRIRFAFAGCQHFEHGHFTAWRKIAEEADLDFVFHYGDYIYEYAGRQPGQRGWGPIVRSHLGEETMSLADYRLRYAQYRTDPDLQAAHAAHSFLPSYDDHEVDNNWAGPFSEEDGRGRFPVAVPPEVFALRKAAAFQAWYENMPVRRAALPRGPDITAYRRVDFGTLMRVNVLDTRQFRDDQPCGDGAKPACPEVFRAEAQMLGAAQEAWLLEGMARSPARWNILAQQIPLMRRELRDGAISMDKWDAYPAARQRLLDGIAERRAPNPVVLSGDVHVALAATIRRRPEDASSVPVATEFTATSVTSEGDGAEMTRGGEEILRRNPDIALFHARRGYCVAEATAQRMTTEFVALPFVTREGAPRETAARMVVEAGRAEVVQA